MPQFLSLTYSWYWWSSFQLLQFYFTCFGKLVLVSSITQFEFLTFIETFLLAITYFPAFFYPSLYYSNYANIVLWAQHILTFYFFKFFVRITSKLLIWSVQVSTTPFFFTPFPHPIVTLEHWSLVSMSCLDGALGLYFISCVS